MGDVQVLSRTQKIIVNPSVSVNVVSSGPSSQKIIVKSTAAVTVVNAGPAGPPGHDSTVPGPQGLPGQDSTVPGPQGPPGSPGTYAFVFDQGSPDDVWHIVHNLGFYPAVSIVDSAGSQVEGQVIYNSINDLDVSFTLPFGGKAFLS